MTTSSQSTQIDIKPGQSFDAYYGNGCFSGVKTITRITDKSVFVNTLGLNDDYRQSLNSIRRYVQKGSWKLRTSDQQPS
jgi:hypothetical protein